MTDADTYRTAPIDEGMRTAAADRGLEARAFTVDDAEAYDAWLQTTARGFLDGERSPEQLAAARERSAHRRLISVCDPTAPDPAAPVATFASWISELTVPGGRGIPSCAISAVTVAPTHRRRGLARSMMEGELRTAVAAGVPMAMLTVSESTLYGRYGFAPAAASASWRIDVKRASWIGPVPEGRVDFITRELFRSQVDAMHERVRLGMPGEIHVQPVYWDTFAGTRPDAKDPGKLRAIQYADAAGQVRGLAIYSVKENHDDFTKASVRISYLLAESADAYAALWRFFIELDLVGEVHAGELSVDEPLWWMISDQRAAVVTVADHHYLRVLDVPAALVARSFGAPGVIALDVTDPLGVTPGRWVLRVGDDGRGEVTPWEGSAAPEGAIVMRLGIAELSAIYLGGVSVATLADAGRIETTDAAAPPRSAGALGGASGRVGPAAAASRVFGWHRAPRLSIWY